MYMQNDARRGAEAEKEHFARDLEQTKEAVIFGTRLSPAMI